LRGYNVNLYDLSGDVLTKAHDYIRTWLESSVRKGAMEEEQLGQTIGKIRLTSNLGEAVEDVDYVQESVPENLGLKKRVFSEVSSLAKSSAILASSTSGLSMTEIQKVALHPEMCITVHPINPPHLIPLVEIVPGKETREDVVKAVYGFMLRLQKIPIIVKKELPGFVFNRLAAALWREALDLLDKDVATAEDIDKAVYAGMGLRWAIMGPFLTYHLGGGEEGLQYFIDHLGPAFSAWWKSMATWTSIPPSAAKKAVDGVNQMEIVKAKGYEELVRWRDERLMKLLEVLGG
jgi:3-hydroxypropionate dehydrogenase (NADP+)